MFIEVTAMGSDLKCLTNLDLVEDLVEQGTGCLICYKEEGTRHVKESYDEVRKMVFESGSLAHAAPTETELHGNVKRETVTLADSTLIKTSTLIKKIVSVDTACLLLGDAGVLKELGLWGGKYACDVTCEDVHAVNPSDRDEDGKALCDVVVRGGGVRDVFLVPIPSGQVFLGDPCHYMEENDWKDFLHKTDYMNKLPPGVFCLGTSCDGAFETTMLVYKP